MVDIALHSAKEQEDQIFGGPFSIKDIRSHYADYGYLIVELEPLTDWSRDNPTKRNWRKSYIRISFGEVPGLVKGLADQFDEMYRKLKERGLLKRGEIEINLSDLHIKSVAFSETELVVLLADGRKISTPLDWYPHLKEASTATRENYKIMSTGIHWPDLDEDLSVAGMLVGNRAR